MAPSIFGSSTNREISGVSLFEIRLNENPLILRGHEIEASGTMLRGSLVLDLCRPLSVRSVRLRLTGEKEVGWHEVAPTWTHIRELEYLFCHTWEFVIPHERSTETLEIGNHKWPFEYEIPGNCPESVEGLTDSWVIYRMKATIQRGLLQQNTAFRKHVRIIRTLDPSSLALCQPVSTQHISGDKLDYTVSTPTRGVVFGTVVRVDFKMIPLLKGLTIAAITCELVEFQNLRIVKGDQHSESCRVILTKEWECPEGTEMVEVDGQDGYRFHRLLQMPKSLNVCAQSVDTKGIRVKHEFHITIRLQNPDGHQSGFRAMLPIIIFISPHLPLDDNNNIIGDPNTTLGTSEAFDNLAPPLYGAHLFDQFYSEVDVSGYMTPAGGPSGPNTPSTSHSRTTSTDNLAPTAPESPSEFAAGVFHRFHGLANQSNQWLRDRARILSAPDESLNDGGEGSSREGNPLQLATNASPAGGALQMSGGSPAPRGSNNPTPRRASQEAAAGTSTQATSEHFEFSTEALNKVPSYNTARQSRAVPLVDDGLPDYQSAISDPIVPTVVPPTPGDVHSGVNQQDPAP